jgi:hypothetical protein
MQRAKLVTWVCAAFLLALSGMQVKAQGQSSPAAQALTVPDQVAAAYRWGDFAELERLYEIYGKAGVRSELTGNPRVEHFWMGIGKINNSDLRVTDEYYQQLDALTERWAREHPRSVLAQVLYAQALKAHAWVYRGSGLANTVSAAAWTGFRKYLDLALAQLKRTEALAASDSSWNEIMLAVGRGLGWDRERLMAVFTAGVAKNPDHDSLYFAMQEALLPKWGGDLETIDRFIALAVKNTREKRGMEMYARLYAGLSYSELHQALFTGSRASWTSMKAGFEDRLKRYPHVDHRNMYAYFACMANDRPTLQEQLELIGDKFEANFWGANAERTFESCKRLAWQL